MNYVVYKAYKTEKAAIKYAEKMFKEHGIILGVEFVGGIYMVGA